MKRPEDIAKAICKTDEELKYVNVYKRIEAVMYAYQERAWRDKIMKLYSYDIDKTP